MSIVLARIDDRLIHGQVVEGWLKTIQADHIVIVSDDVAKDKMQQTLMAMAVPKDIKVSSLTIEDAASKIIDGSFSKDRLLLLFSSPKDVRRLLDKGVKLSSVNVGGMHFSPGKKQILPTMSVDKEDVEELLDICGRGIELEGRVIPVAEKINVSVIIEKEFGSPR
ncbi:MAG: PTS sugar transporter subunit IIB [Elusimicrobiota bacterium]